MSAAESAGFSPARLAALDRFLAERYVGAGKLPGYQLQIWRRGLLAHESMAGFADVAEKRPVKTDTVFRIYSMTKQIVGVTVLRLVEEGRLNLYDKVSDHIPSWAGLKVLEDGKLVESRRPMTIHDLARHTSGLGGMGMGGEVMRMYQERRFLRFDNPHGLEGLIEELAGLPLEYHPGEHTTYSIGMWVLGYVIQKVCGRPLGEALRELIFDPLGMADTGFFCPPAKAHRLAALYRWKDGAYALDGEYDFTKPPMLESGDGGLVSTAADFMRFSRMLLNGGTLDGVQILSPKSVELLRINHLPGGKDLAQLAAPGSFVGWPVAGMGVSICCGTTVDVAARGMPGSTGTIYWSGAANTHPLTDPSEDLALVLMAQVLGAPFFFDLMRSVHTMVYGAMTASNGANDARR